MKTKIKIKIYSHTAKFLRKKFNLTDTEPLDLRPTSLVSNYIKVSFSGRTYVNIFKAEEKVISLEILISDHQIRKYKKESHDFEFVISLEDFFKTQLFDFIKNKQASGFGITESCRLFLEEYDLYAEDINLEMLRKKYYRVLAKMDPKKT